MSFRTDPATVTGSIAPLFTPFADDLSVDHDSLRRMVRWQLANGSDGISIGGSTGEPSAQTVEERIAAIRTVADEIGGRVPFLPGTGSGSMAETIEMTKAAADAGADMALIITPYYAKPTQEALYQWYARVCREFPDLPIVAYNVPTRTAVEIDPGTVGRLYEDFENFVGVKETTKDFEHFSRVKYEARDILLWSGIELLCLPILAIGGSGFISALANIAPKAVAEMYDAAVGGDMATAIDLHYRLTPLVDVLFVETNPAPAKWLMHEQGLISSPNVREPLINLTADGLTKVRALVDKAPGLLTPVEID